VVEAGEHDHPGIAQDFTDDGLDRLSVSIGGHIRCGSPVLGEHIGDAGQGEPADELTAGGVELLVDDPEGSTVGALIP